MTSEARREYLREYYRKNREKILAQTKKYAQEHPEVRRGIERRFRAAHPEQMTEYNTGYYAANREHLLARKREYVTQNKKAIAARIKASNAIRAGKLIPLPCWECSNEKVEAHHPDYDAPLDVVWLCHSCHMRLHRGV